MEKTIDEKKQGETLIIPSKSENSKKLFIESYGCSMNFSDSEIVASILQNEGFNTTPHLEEADLVLVNTCSIRDKAEQTRISIRNSRRDANDEVKKTVEAESLPEDSKFEAEDEVQKITDSNIKKVDDYLSQKESEIMTV